MTDEPHDQRAIDEQPAQDESADETGTDESTVEQRQIAEEIGELLRQGKRVHAVKRYREATGVDLVTAVEAIDKIALRHGLSNSPGCSVTVLVIALSLLTVARLLPLML